MLDTSERLKTLIARFVLKYNFWGYVFSRVRRKADTRLKSIMGVAPESDGTITLYYNPPLVDGTDDATLTKIIEHEGLHLILKHIPRLLRILMEETDNFKKNIKIDRWNIATDCTVNMQAKFKDDFVINGKKWPICLPEKYELPNGKISEWYYLELLKNTKIINVSLVGDHDKWKDNIKGVTDLSALSRKVEQHTRRLIKESIKSFSKERGKLPAHIAELIDDILGPPKAPYYQIIRKLVLGTRLTKFLRAPTRINRKRTYAFHLDPKLPQISPFPGLKRDHTFNIVILVDTSGSMGDNDVREALSGTKHLLEKDRNCYVTVLEVDSAVEKEYECKRIKDIQFNIKGRGGTTIGPGLFRAKELECDVCLAFTDGFTENINAIPRKYLPKKIIWVITKQGTSKNLNRTGFVVHI